LEEARIVFRAFSFGEVELASGPGNIGKYPYVGCGSIHQSFASVMGY
jgi:hypothetical protein